MVQLGICRKNDWKSYTITECSHQRILKKIKKITNIVKKRRPLIKKMMMTMKIKMWKNVIFMRKEVSGVVKNEKKGVMRMNMRSATKEKRVVKNILVQF
jgi:hypothetical protein